MLPSNTAVRLMMLVGLALPVSLAALPVRSAETHTFEAPDGAYTFKFSQGLRLQYEFADGTGEVTGVGLSNPTTGDVSIQFYARPATTITEVSEQTRQAVIDDYTKSVAVLPTIKFKSATMTTMLGQPAMDMVFENRRFGAPHINRFVATFRDGKEYNFTCFYRADKADQFAPACDLAVSTVRLLDTAAKAKPATTAGDEDDKPASAGTCTKLELNKRIMEVSELASDMLAKDQLPATIERVQKAHVATMAIDERAGRTPSAQDCKDVEAIAATLK